MHHTLQQMNTKPRHSANPRLAQTDNFSRSIGDDGILYILTNKEDYAKYKVVSDEEMVQEWNSTAKAYKQTQRERPRSANSRFQTPYSGPKKFGGRQSVGNFDPKKTDDEFEAKLQRSTSEAEKRTVRPTPDLNSASIDILKGKYEENLGVIEKLFKEKKQMEKQMKFLQGKVVKSRNMSPQDPDHPRKHNRDNAHRGTADAFSASEIADIFGEEPSVDAGVMTRSKSVCLDDRGRSRAKSSSASRLGHSADGMRDSSVGRSLSAGRFNVSVHLQADQDKYVQRRRAAEEREKQAVAEQRAYEMEKEARLLKACLNGKEPTEMAKRHHHFHKLKQDKIAQEQQKKLDEEEAEIRARRKALQMHMSRPLLKHDKTWEEVEMLDRLNRKERIEKRKQEMNLAVSMARPPSYNGSSIYGPGMGMGETTRHGTPMRQSDRRSSAGFGSGMNTGRERGNSATRASPPAASDPAAREVSDRIVAAMAQRQREQDERRRRRVEERARKEAEAEARRVTERQAQIDKVMRAQLPETSRRLTKAAEHRTNLITSKLEKEKADELKKQKSNERKMKQEKEAAAVLKTMIALNEQDRKSKHGGYVELKASETLAAEKAREAREQYKQALRANKEKLKQAQQNRPSLIQRHDQSLVQKNAATNALLRVADAMGGGKKNDDGDGYDDDLFDEDEKMILRARPSATTEQ